MNTKDKNKNITLKEMWMLSDDIMREMEKRAKEIIKEFNCVLRKTEKQNQNMLINLSHIIGRVERVLQEKINQEQK